MLSVGNKLDIWCQVQENFNLRMEISFKYMGKSNESNGDGSYKEESTSREIKELVQEKSKI